MKISIIIPTYKPQNYLWECLDSLCRQTFNKQDFEIILILNGCDAPYQTQIKKYVSKHMQDVNIHFIHTKQPGVSNARNIGLDNAKGEFVTFIDDDDYVSENFLQGMYNAISNGTIPVSNMKAFKDGESGFVYYEKEMLFNQLKGKIRDINEMRKFLSISVAKLLPLKEVIKDRRFNLNFKNGEDSLFMFLISDGIKHLSFSTDDAIYYRRYRANSALTAKKSFSYILNSRMALAKAYTKIYFSHPTKYNFTFYTTRLLACIKAILFKQP